MKQYHLIRILQQICHLFRFWKKFKIFFEKPIYFSKKNRQILNVLRILTISVAFYGKFATIYIYLFIFKQYHLIRILQQICHFFRFWKKIQDFFSKNPSIFPKKQPNFERFENSYYFSRILRQICYNLMKKRFHIQTCEQPMLARLRELNWQTSGKKTHLFERKILVSIFSIWRKIIKRRQRFRLIFRSFSSITSFDWSLESWKFIRWKKRGQVRSK